MNICNVSVIIPTYERPHQLLETIDKILQCNPKPDEIVIHIDGDDRITEPAIRNRHFQNIVLLRSAQQVGPGGGRNRAITLTKHSIVASFDDDSYPIDTDYFARLLELFADFPQAAVIGAAIYHQGETIAPDDSASQWVADFVGCGCAYRKDAFLQTSGYVPLPVAYGMEEVDLSLRLHQQGWQVLSSSWLRVFHNTHLTHHTSPKITAASIANLALLSYLRYPPQLWGVGLLQCLNRVRWLLRNGRYAGILMGLISIPKLIWHHRHYRQTVTPECLRLYQHLRQRPTLAHTPPFSKPAVD